MVIRRRTPHPLTVVCEAGIGPPRRLATLQRMPARAEPLRQMSRDLA